MPSMLRLNTLSQACLSPRPRWQRGWTSLTGHQHPGDRWAPVVSAVWSGCTGKPALRASPSERKKSATTWEQPDVRRKLELLRPKQTELSLLKVKGKLGVAAEQTSRSWGSSRFEPEGFYSNANICPYRRKRSIISASGGILGPWGVPALQGPVSPALREERPLFSGLTLP